MTERRLEIGPHKRRIEGFETTDIVKSPLVDHVADCRALPFRSGTFDLVYASHVIEHIEWTDVERTVAEWARIVKPGGHLEVHTVDSYRIAKMLVEYEETGKFPEVACAWRAEMHRYDPYLIMTGRILNFPKGGSIHQLHRSMITPGYLKQCFARAGLTDFVPLTRSDLRGQLHPEWITFGIRGTKP